MQTKKAFLFCTILLLSEQTLSQIIISNTPNALYATVGGNAYGANGTYNVDNTFTFPGLSAFDAGTNQYVGGGNVFAGLDFYQVIRRVSNEWVIAWAYNYQGNRHTGIHYKAVTTRTNIDPPCNDLWDEYLYEPLNNITTGVKLGVILIGTTCVVQPIVATVMTPIGLTLPQLTNAAIAAISNPSAGTIVWSTDDNCIKVFNGTSWNCL